MHICVFVNFVVIFMYSVCIHDHLTRDDHALSNKIPILEVNLHISTTRKMKFSIQDFLSKCVQIRSLIRIWSYLLKKSLMENFIFLCSARFHVHRQI